MDSFERLNHQGIAVSSISKRLKCYVVLDSTGRTLSMCGLPYDERVGKMRLAVARLSSDNVNARSEAELFQKVFAIFPSEAKRADISDAETSNDPRNGRAV